MKTCTKCHLTQPLTNFSIGHSTEAVRQSICKSCVSIHNAAYYQKHRAQLSQQKRLYQREKRQADPIGTAQAMQKWRNANQSTLRRKQREYRRKHRQHIRDYNRTYYASHPELFQNKGHTWRQENPDRVLLYSHQRRARIYAAPVNDFSPAQREEILAAYGYRCVYCPPDCHACRRRTHRLTMDHITPLSKGGSNTATNIVPACKSCNSKKHVGDPLVPVQPLLFTIAPPTKKD